MTNEEILKKAIEKAVENEWKFEYINVGADWIIKNRSVNDVIWNHDFAKAFWGETPLIAGSPVKTLTWEHNLQQMVLEPEPLKYLEQFLGGELSGDQ